MSTASPNRNADVVTRHGMICEPGLRHPSIGFLALFGAACQAGSLDARIWKSW